MNYKERIYKSYFSNHTLHRKGEETLDSFKKRSNTYEKQFGEFLPKNKDAKIIDLGCGNGSIIWWLQQRGFTNSEGIDISAEQVEIANKLGVKNIIQADLTKPLIGAQGFYDVIFMRDVLEHYEKEDIIKVLDKCFSALKDNGIIIIQVPNAESPFGSRIRYGDFTHEIAFTSGSISQVLRTIGFNDIHVKAWESSPNLSLSSVVRFVLWQMVASFYRSLLMIEGIRSAIVTQNIIAVAKK